MTNKSNKMRTAIAARKAKFKAQTVRIDDNWVIKRFDELNWEIRYHNKFNGYFPSIVSALRSLPAKMLNEAAKNTLSEVLRSAEGIQSTIDKAIP